MNRQQSMKKCAAIKRAPPLRERRKVERMGRMIHKAAAERKRSPEFAAKVGRVRDRGSHSSDLESGR